jgi:hypothetical protein
MKLTDLTKHDHAVRALKENFEVNFKVGHLNKGQTQTLLNKVRGLMSEAREAKDFGSSYPSYMKLVFMEQALKEHYRNAPEMRKAKVIVENEEVNRSQVILAAQDMVDSVQKMLEEVSDMIVKEMPALVDSVQTEIGVNEAQAFDQTAGQALAELQQSLTSVKGQLDQALSGITGGEVVDAFDGEVDAGGEEMPAPEAPAELDAEVGAEVPAPVAGAEEVEANVDVETGPIGRAKR